MMPEILEYGLELISAVTIIFTGVYRWRHVHGQEANVTIESIHQASYAAHVRNSAMAFGRTGQYYEELKCHETDRHDDIAETRYLLRLTVENSGRASATVSSFALSLPDTEEELEMSLNQAGSSVRLPGNGSNELELYANGDVREDYDGDIKATFQIESPAGGDTASVTVIAR